MDNGFIYALNPIIRDELLLKGMILLKSDDKNSIYVFKGTEEMMFDYNIGDVVFSDVLIF